jgi:hypothetical protein
MKLSNVVSESAFKAEKGRIDAAQGVVMEIDPRGWRARLSMRRNEDLVFRAFMRWFQKAQLRL